MHGLINKSVERFVRDTYGRDVWVGVTRRLDLGFTEFEALLTYDPDITQLVLDEVAQTLAKARSEVLEDIGTYLVSHPSFEALRRLLRFGGVTFVEFLQSLDDLPERTRLALSDFDLPRLELSEHSNDFYTLTVYTGDTELAQFGYVVVGLLRAMADDYGALVLLEHKGVRGGTEIVEIHLLEMAFADGRAFDLGARAR
ncbi:Heme NO binding protein [Roseovarius litorisediminis]|uniref:Heme NO binding protein n=1 Tax=Roseovarius litorisediminis TaxID=1312363 RepID=A0A1Y5RZE9_9RHOB|nr:heme NO-binding domain-containing protein [Roseovarius litorisediminis]SLN27723.1 Heme NO binding protein [Roseovarius litorisediminis]